MTLSDFVDRHLAPQKAGRPAEERTAGYLAQHALFDQVPLLSRDIQVPEYCALGGGRLEAINAWLGPAGTVTPLHHDPHHNLLAQVVGQKYVRLYAAAEGARLYPHTESMLRNSSQVDVELVDVEKFPLFAGAPYVECVLAEGEMLYIPPKWWHFVKSLTTSFSVSFWWSVDAES